MSIYFEYLCILFLHLVLPHFFNLELPQPTTSKTPLPKNRQDLDDNDLFHALKNNKIKQIKNLFEEKGPMINTWHEVLGSPLHMAIRNNNEELTKFLLELGANPNAYTQILGTPLHVAVDNNNKKIAELLLNAGAKINAFHPSWGTPTDLARRRCFLCLLEWLVKKGGKCKQNFDPPEFKARIQL